MGELYEQFKLFLAIIACNSAYNWSRFDEYIFSSIRSDKIRSTEI